MQDIIYLHLGKETLGGIKEWQLNNEVCNYIKEELSKYKDVEIIRLDDTKGLKKIDITSRLRNALNHNSDLLVSIHHNAYSGTPNNISGTEIFYHANAHHKKAIELANIIAPKLSQYTVGKNRGVKAQRLAVISTSRIPAILCEGGFMDSRIDEPIITSYEGKKNYARAVVEGIVELFKLESEEEKMIKELCDIYTEKAVKKALVTLIESVNDDGLPDDWAKEELQKAKELGITDGNNPEMFATRQEVAMMVYRATK